MFRRQSRDRVSVQEVLQALSTVVDPDLKRDIVSLGFVKNLRLQDGRVSFDLELTTPACPLKEVMKQAAEEVVSALPGVEEVRINLTARVRPGPSLPQRVALPGVRNLIAVASGKGGVGKSTVASNLTVALAQTGAQVGLMDADIYGPNVPIMLGEHRRPGTNPQGQIVPLEKYGVRLMSLGLLTDERAPVIWRGPLVSKMVQEFLTRVAWGELDYLIVDLPPGTGDAQLTLAQSAPLSGAIIVTTPQEVALEDVIRALRMFQRVEVPLLGLVENMSYYLCPHCGQRAEIFRHGGGRRAAEQLGLPFLGEIPLDPEICLTGDQGTPLVVTHPQSPSAQAFREIASAVAAQVSIVNLTAHVPSS